MADAKTFLQLKDDMKTAMKAREKVKLGTIRMLISALKNKAIDLRADLTEEDVIAVLTSEGKKRRDSIELYRKGEREDLAEIEEVELALILTYLPKQLTDEEVAVMVDEVIAQTGASAKSDMGKVMGAMMPKVKGLYDGKKVKALVMSKLG